MHSIRQGRVQASPVIFIFLFASLVFIFMFTHFNHVREQNKLHNSSHKCMKELESVKYQLDAVTSYKHQMDGLVQDGQQHVGYLKGEIKTFNEEYTKTSLLLETCEFQNEELEYEATQLKKKLADTQKQLDNCLKRSG